MIAAPARPAAKSDPAAYETVLVQMRVRRGDRLLKKRRRDSLPRAAGASTGAAAQRRDGCAPSGESLMPSFAEGLKPSDLEPARWLAQASGTGAPNAAELDRTRRRLSPERMPNLP